MLFNDPEVGFFTSWFNFIIYSAILFSVIWVFCRFFETKTGKTIEKGSGRLFYPIAKWYENLSFNIRNFVGWLAIVFYCLSIIALFIVLES